jgi:hypothetical protein
MRARLAAFDEGQLQHDSVCTVDGGTWNYAHQLSVLYRLCQHPCCISNEAAQIHE